MHRITSRQVRDPKGFHISDSFSRPTTLCRRSESLGLIIAARGVKPAVAMKTLSGTLAFVVLAVIAIVTILSCQTLHYANRRPEHIIGNPDVSPRQYRELKKPLPQGEDDFRAALKTLKKNGGDCQIYFLRKYGADEVFNYCDDIHVSLKTDKITRSEAANRVGADESTANDPHATYRIASPSQPDIDAVLQTLKQP
jgi:hypothetical protein